LRSRVWNTVRDFRRAIALVAAGVVGAVAMVGAPAVASADSSWSEPATLGPTAGDSGPAAIAIAPDGEAIATWAGSRQDGVMVSTRRPGQGWSTPIVLAPIEEEVEGPEVAVAAGKAVIVWCDNVRTRSGATRVVLAATRLRGRRWSKPQNVSAEKRWRDEPYGEEPQVAMTRGGKAIAIWKASDEGHSTTSFIRSATQAAAGTKWSAPVAIRGSVEGEVPQVGATPAGETVAIWGASYDEESGIEASSRPAKGLWRGAGRLGYPGPFPDPQLAITSKGEAIGVWVHEPEDGYGAEVQVATRKPGGKWKVKSLDPSGYGTDPEIVTEPGGRAKVIWVKGDSFEAQELVASTRSAGGEWTVPASLAAEGLQLPPAGESKFAVNGAGETIAVWSSRGSVGEELAVQAWTRPRGGPWSGPTAVFAAPPGPTFGGTDLQVAVAPSGEGFAVWRCFDGSEWVIKAATHAAAS
jgi:hypothetical protein